MLILYKRPREKRKKTKKIVIVQFKDSEVNEIYNSVFKNPELVGRLKNMRYIFLDGHIYYNNSVIKIRYDILKNNSKSFKSLGENELFDYYVDKIFDTGKAT